MNHYGDDLQRFYVPQRQQKPGVFRSWRGILKVAILGIVCGTIWAAIASSCSMHHTWTAIAQQPPGVIMEFKPTIVEPMPNVVPAIDLDEQEVLSI